MGNFLRSLIPSNFEFQLTRLEEIRPEYFDFLVRIQNDYDLMKNYRDLNVVVNNESQQKWYERYLTKDQRYFIVLDKKSNQPIGTCGFTYYDYQMKNLIGGWLLMDKKSDIYRKAHLLEFRHQLINYCFSKHINYIYAYVYKKSDSIIKLHEKFGYVYTGQIAYPDYLNNRIENKVIEMRLDKPSFDLVSDSLLNLKQQLIIRGL